MRVSPAGEYLAAGVTPSSVILRRLTRHEQQLAPRPPAQAWVPFGGDRRVIGEARSEHVQWVRKDGAADLLDSVDLEPG
jgi:hypothetical protein